MRAFWFHYNKPASAQQKRNVLSLHFMGKCHLVHDIEVDVPLKTRHRKEQPRCVLAGVGVVELRETESGILAVIARGPNGE